MAAKKILIIDDEEWLIQPILDRLDYEKIDYDYVQDCSDGLKIFNESSESYNAVVLDMKLPFGEFLEDLDPELLIRYPIPGIYVLEQIRQNDTKIPILCFTVLEDHHVHQHTSKWNAKHYKKGKDEESMFREIHKFSRKGF